MRISNRVFSWTALAVAAVANVAGYLFNLYRLTYFDDLLHGITLFAITLAFADFIDDRVLSGHRSHRFLLFLTITTIGVGIGGFWEIFEWTYDAMTVADSILGKNDTMMDLVTDTFGSATAAIVHIALRRRSAATVDGVFDR